ncbi:MAG: hypothetical protein GY928_03470 [Colwellia sp.]|nr:hypothetical protein [Colwellia sp.]
MEFGVAKDIKVLQVMENQLEAIKLLAKQEKGSSITKNRAGAYQLQVQRKVGQWGRALKKNKGGQATHKTYSSLHGDEYDTKQPKQKKPDILKTN